MTDNVAILDGYTIEYHGVAKPGSMAGSESLHVLVKPDTDMDDTIEAWDMDEQEYIHVFGWLFEWNLVL